MRHPMTHTVTMTPTKIGVALLIVLMLLTVLGCSLFKLAEVSPERIPLEVRKDREDDEVIWRACYEQDGYTIVWFEWVEPKSGINTYNYCAYRRDESGALVLEKGFGQNKWDPPYDWVHGSGEGQIHAFGVAFSSRAHKAIGEVGDRKVEGLVVNGFWYLAAYGPPFGGWARIEIQDDQGRVLAVFH